MMKSALYNSNWTSIHEKKNWRELKAMYLQMFIRSQKEVAIEAGGITKLSFETFTNVVNLSYSVFTLLFNQRQSK
jgi:hypothetical protein